MERQWKNYPARGWNVIYRFNKRNHFNLFSHSIVISCVFFRAMFVGLTSKPIWRSFTSRPKKCKVHSGHYNYFGAPGKTILLSNVVAIYLENV